MKRSKLTLQKIFDDYMWQKESWRDYLETYPAEQCDPVLWKNSDIWGKGKLEAEFVLRIIFLSLQI